MKHDERRRSGRKLLAHDMEQLPPEAALARNLRCQDYVALVCGSLDNLPKAFADLDQQSLRELARAEGSNPAVSTPPDVADILSASLPGASFLIRSSALMTSSLG